MMRTLPKKCDLCGDKIGLYQPWYSLGIDSHFTLPRRRGEEYAICPACFRTYENFMISQKERIVLDKMKRDIRYDK